MKTIKDFTPSIRKKIQTYKDKAVVDLYNGNEYANWKRKDTVDYIEYIYAMANQPHKPVVIVADNLIEYQKFYNLLFNPKLNKSTTKLVNYIWNQKNKENSKLRSDLDSELYSQLQSELYSKLDSELYSELGFELQSQLGSELDSELQSELQSELDSELCSELYSELGFELYSELYSDLDSELQSKLSFELDSKLRYELSFELQSELDYELYSELHSQLHSELYSELYSELTSELRCKLSSELSSELDSELDSKLYSELHSELQSELRSELSSELDYELNSKLSSELNIAPKYHYLFLTYEYSRVYLMWYKFIKDEFNLPTKKAKELDWLYENVNKANISRCFLCKKVVLALRMPQQIIRNSQSISNVNGPAIIYPNQKLYYINGVKISEQLFNELTNQKYTFDQWTKEKNEEVKSAVLFFYQEKFGDEFVFRFLSEHLKEVDTYVDKKDEQYLVGTTKGMNVGVYTLFKGNINSNEIAYVRCYCPSTDRMFFLGVNPENTNAKDAIASLYSIPKKLVNEILSIQRQGEIFSTNFTEKGLLLLKEMSQKDIQDTTGISGTNYFNLIKYEY